MKSSNKTKEYVKKLCNPKRFIKLKVFLKNQIIWKEFLIIYQQMLGEFNRRNLLHIPHQKYSDL
jgi:hypothetical protein